MKKALVTGISGQAGSYLAELLLEKGCEVHGFLKPHSRNLANLEGLRGRLQLTAVDLLDDDAVARAVGEIEPDEIYHLAGSASADESWTEPASAGETAGLAAARLLRAVFRYSPHSRYFQACSSDIFGSKAPAKISETTPADPQNPQAAAQAYARQLADCYRSQHGMYACTGISFPHESPRRRPEFISRTITRAAAAIALGIERKLSLADLDAACDWGFTKDVVRGYWIALQVREPSDYVFGSGELHTVRQFVEYAFEHVGLNWQDYVETGPNATATFSSVPHTADIRRAFGKLGWRPQVTFREMVRNLVDSDVLEVRRLLRRRSIRAA